MHFKNQIMKVMHDQKLPHNLSDDPETSEPEC